MAFQQQPTTQERRSQEAISVSEYFQGTRRFYHAAQCINIVKVFAGDWYVSGRDDEMLATFLGSCVSACIRDPIINVGGMNHFLLPGDEKTMGQASDAARYGVYAMERLINGVLKAGGRKERLEIKVFGGGNVLQNTARIGSMNARFIRDFLRNEGYRIASEDLEGDCPRSVHYYPVTGKVMMRQLRRREDMVVLVEEERYQSEISKKPIEGDIELF